MTATHRRTTSTRLRNLLSASCAVLAMSLVAAPVAQAQTATATFDIRPTPLAQALLEYGRQAGVSVAAPSALTAGRVGGAVSGRMTTGQAIETLLAGTGLRAEFSAPDAVRIVPDAKRPQSGDLAQDVEPATLSEVIVTAQKREELIQDVPIAISAFSGSKLNDLKIEGGSELLRAVPNVSFSKGNFSGYNFSIRGIGTKAVSASTDPAVAVSFNNTALLRNRLFEQEFFDLQRVEVLRGPQGTLYGRNATGGVVNIISALPSSTYEGEVKAEIGNFDSRRLSGMVNIPVGDTFALRFAGALTQRDGFEYNSVTGNRINGRDLWSTRLSARWQPTDDFTADLIWQHFDENDSRSRSGKQLCTRDDGPLKIGQTDVPAGEVRARFSQGCLPGSLHDDKAFGVPNAESFPHIAVASGVGWGADSATGALIGFRPGDPYAGLTQSRDLREIASTYDPVFRARNDLFQLNLAYDISDALTLYSQTSYAKDSYYSSQDYNRFVSQPVFGDSDTPGLVDFLGNPVVRPGPTPGGVFNDPQLGPSKGMLSVDISRSQSRQFSQEFRLQSDFGGKFEFSLGANYLNFKSRDDYYVFNNVFTFLAQYFYNLDSAGVFANPRRNETRPCHPTGPNDTTADCVYVDPNAIGSVNDLGHNYFLSRNPVKTESWALFGEAYWNITDTVKITAGLRYTDDQKTSTPTPSQLLLAAGPVMTGASGGRVSIGYPTGPDIVQSWRKYTGRLVVDWKPDLSFTDETLLYASYSRGYKGGGTNPPRVDIDPAVVQFQFLPQTFAPEYVNAFEIGTKNVLADGRLTLNATAFLYDYTDYQVSQIVDRISYNENFDARNWGLEFETTWRPNANFRVDANLGYLNTRIGKGQQSIDVMDRTQGNEDWVVVRPWVQVPSNCVAPRRHVETILASGMATGASLAALCPGSNRIGTYDPKNPGLIPWYLIFGFQYDPFTEAPNSGRGFAADLSDNELPNSPHLTFNLGAQYTWFLSGWELTVRGDYYRQGDSYARVYNTEYDRLKGWDNTNLAVTLTRPSWDLAMQLYVKNVFDKTPITDVFTNSDDTGLTANVFTLDPRIVGFSLQKRF